MMQPLRSTARLRRTCAVRSMRGCGERRQRARAPTSLQTACDLGTRGALGDRGVADRRRGRIRGTRWTACGCLGDDAAGHPHGHRDDGEPRGQQNQKSVKATKAVQEKDMVPENNSDSQTVTTATEILPKKEVIIYPSQLIYTAKDNNVVINLPDFELNKYIVKIFEEDNKLLFELNKLTEGYLVIEKVNFLHAGWFYFEIYDQGVLLEKNKFFIPRD